MSVYIRQLPTDPGIWFCYKSDNVAVCDVAVPVFKVTGC